VIHKLTHEVGAGGMGDVVGVVDAEGRIGDQGSRTLAEVVVGVEQPTRLPNVEERRTYSVWAGAKGGNSGKSRPNAPGNSGKPDESGAASAWVPSSRSIRSAVAAPAAPTPTAPKKHRRDSRAADARKSSNGFMREPLSTVGQFQLHGLHPLVALGRR
jgi:hypothetical protein